MSATGARCYGWLILLVVLGAGLIVPSAVALSRDGQLAMALVVPQRDVPEAWDGTIVRNPCAITSYPVRVRITAHATTRWGSPTHGLWSVAAVAGSTVQARAEFAHVTNVLPRCMSQWFRHSAPPTYSSRVSIGPLLNFHSEQAAQLRAWRLTDTVRKPNGRLDNRMVFDLVAVRVGRGVAWYQLGTLNEAMSRTVLQHALARAGSASH